MKDGFLIFENLSIFEKEVSKKQFSDKNIIIIENELTRISSKYFQNSLSVKRILCPIIFTEEIFQKLIEFIETLKKDNLIVISLAEYSITVAEHINKLGFYLTVIKSTGLEINDIENLEQVTKKIIEIKESEEFEENKYLSELIKIIIP